MDFHNYYFGQLVVDLDLDDIYADANMAERLHIAQAHGLNQVQLASGDPSILGGILSGLVVTKIDGTHVQVTAGKARDADGRYINVSSTCTVSLAYKGTSQAGDVTPEGDGDAVAVGAGKEAWLSLFVQYGEVDSDLHQDDNGDPVYFRVSESFKFYIGLGAEATAPATDRVGLSNSYVHLADILLDDAESVRSINPGGGVRDVICCTNEDFDYFTSYAAMAGRRSDWVAMENATDFPQFAAQNIFLRSGNPRDALVDLVKKLQKQSADPSGACMVGSAAKAGVQGYGTLRTRNIAAGSLSSQVDALHIVANQVLPRCGMMPMFFYDDFLYVPKDDNGALAPDTDTPYWGSLAAGAGATGLSTDGSNLILQATDPGGNRGLHLGSSAIPTNRQRHLFFPRTTNYVIAVRFKLGLGTSKFSFGFVDKLSNDIAEVIVDGAAHTTVAHVLDSTGGGEDTSTSIWDPTTDMVTIVLEVTDGTTASVRLGVDGTAESAVIDSANLFTNEGHAFFMATWYNGGAMGLAEVDAVLIGELTARAEP